MLFTFRSTTRRGFTIKMTKLTINPFGHPTLVSRKHIITSKKMLYPKSDTRKASRYPQTLTSVCLNNGQKNPSCLRVFWGMTLSSTSSKRYVYDRHASKHAETQRRWMKSARPDDTVINSLADKWLNETSRARGPEVPSKRERPRGFNGPWVSFSIYWDSETWDRLTHDVFFCGSKFLGFSKWELGVYFCFQVFVLHVIFFHNFQTSRCFCWNPCAFMTPPQKKNVEKTTWAFCTYSINGVIQ